MNAAIIYAVAAAMLFCIGIFGFLSLRHLLRRVMALNLCSTAVFMLLIALAARDSGVRADPVPHAMVLTGIVVSISSTALALVLASRLREMAGWTSLPEDEPCSGHGDSPTA